MSVKGLRARLTYANVMSTVALLVALTGGATAIALSLPKNSVKSKQIAPGAVKTGDIAKDAVTGDKVNESTLGKVPAAARADGAGRADSAAQADRAAFADSALTANALTGLSTTEIPRAINKSSSFFDSELPVVVSGFGTYRLRCIVNTGSHGDDEVTFGYNSTLPATAIENGFYATASEPAAGAAGFVLANDEATGFAFKIGDEDDRIYFHYRVTVPGTSKALLIEAGGFDNEGNSGCAGQIQAFVVG
jgi:hypothetical protein